MTFEELLNMDLEKLEALSEEELTRLLTPYIAKARPSDEVKAQVERAASKKDPSKIRMSSSKANELLQAIEAKLKNL